MSTTPHCVSGPMCLRAAEDAGNRNAMSPGRVRSCRYHPPDTGSPSTRDVSAFHGVSHHVADAISHTNERGTVSIPLTAPSHRPLARSQLPPGRVGLFGIRETLEYLAGAYTRPPFGST